MRMLVSICVASVRGDSLPYLVSSINSQTFQDWELIIATQGDDPHLLSFINQNAQHDPRISFMHIPRYGKSYALNQAIDAAKGEIIAFTDDDCVAAPDWLKVTTDCFTQDTRVGIVAGNLVPPPPQRWRISTCPATYTIEYIYRPQEENHRAPSGFYFGGGNMAMRRHVLDLVGRFDPYLGPGTPFPAAEDVDFILRAEAMDVVMWTTPRSIVYHTYGRRFGIRKFIKHHRGYALGSGALGAKMNLWNHQLSEDWNRRMGLWESVVSFMKNPPRRLLDMYKSKFEDSGCSSYMSSFDIDDKIVSRPKSDSARENRPM